MHALDILAIVAPNVLSIVGVGIALAALIMRGDARAEDRFNKAMARSDERFDKAMARSDERSDTATARSDERSDTATARSDEHFRNVMARSDERFDKAMAEIAADRRAFQAGMDEFRREMQRLAERQSRVEGRLDPDTVAAE
ncbi:MAG: hypothetical protein OYH76_01165 [Defluviicoccus sp.]|nr:hypothetical protein [Defluviicoccus sp.]MDE0274473.1 hypothetical protein [Defluviicoccus sp.]